MGYSNNHICTKIQPLRLDNDVVIVHLIETTFDEKVDQLVDHENKYFI